MEELKYSPIREEEIKIAESSAATEENSEINRLVSNLFSDSGSERTEAYNKLTKDGKYRASRYAAELIMEMGEDTFGKPDNFIGLYHTIVTLTSMSRAVTQMPDISQDIIDYSDQVVDQHEKLRNRVKTLQSWVTTSRQ